MTITETELMMSNPEAVESEPTVRHKNPWPFDLRIDHEGIWQEGFRQIDVPLPESCHATAWLLVVQTRTGTWQAAGFLETDAEDGLMDPLAADDPQYETEREALRSAVEEIDTWYCLQCPNESLADRARKTLDDFRAQIDAGKHDSPAAEVTPDELELPEAPAAASDAAEADYAAELAAAEKVVADLACEIAEVKAHLKSLNKCLAEGIDNLARIHLRGPERLPLFDSAFQAPKPAEAVTDAPAGPMFFNDNPIALWRSVTTAELGLPSGLCKILAEANIKFLGDIADWTAGGKALTAIPKVGKAKAELIEEAREEYWAKHKT